MVKKYYILFFLYILFFAVGILNFFAGQYATVLAGTGVPDFFDFFSNPQYEFLRKIAISIHLYWAHFLVAPFLIYGSLFYVDKTIRYFSLHILLTLFRVLTINVTHLGKVLNQPIITGSDYTFGGDLFFSGHVAFTFLLFLVFKDTPLKYLILVFHIVVTVSTIIGRFHYTIDIIAAYAITYSLYKLSENFWVVKNKSQEALAM